MEQLERRKDGMIAALWANTNLDDGKGARNQIITEIEDNYQEIIDQVLDRDWAEKKRRADEEYENNPFFRKAREGVERLDHRPGFTGTVQQVVATEQSETDQS